MTMQVLDRDLQLAAGLGALFSGVGILGPYGAVPAQAVPAGTYEITGTQVALRDAPGGAEKGRFNDKYGKNNDLVVEPVDQVDFNGQVGNQGGLSWAQVTVKSGALAGSSGYVAMEFMAPVGWTKQHSGVGPITGGGGGGGGITPASSSSDSTTTSDYAPYVLAAAGGVGLLIIGWAVFSKPKHGGARHRSGRRRHGGHRRRAH